MESGSAVGRTTHLRQQAASPSAFNISNRRESRQGPSRTIDLWCNIAELKLPGTVHSAGNLESLQVLRRLTAVVVIWVSLLGAAFPAFACTLAALNSECCGQTGATPPCAGDVGFGQPMNTTTASCCASGHEAFPGAAFDSDRTSPERAHEHSPPEPFVLIAWSASWLARVLAPLTTPTLRRPPPSGAALTYLRTARLRL
jgi:hypothetical protein